MLHRVVVSQVFATSSVALVTLLTDRRADLRGAGVGVCSFLLQDLRAFLQPLGQISECVICVTEVDYGRWNRRGFLTTEKGGGTVGGIHYRMETVSIVC